MHVQTQMNHPAPSPRNRRDFLGGMGLGFGSLALGRIPCGDDHLGSSPNKFNGGRFADPCVAPGKEDRPASNVPGALNHMRMILAAAHPIDRIKGLPAGPYQYFNGSVRESCLRPCVHRAPSAPALNPLPASDRIGVHRVD